MILLLLSTLSIAFQHLDKADGCVTGLVRLTNEDRGRVEVCVNNTWGTVCQNGFIGNDADVICHQLGYPSVRTYHYDAYYGEGDGPIWFDRLLCYGDELTLFQCSSRGVGVHSCGHFQDVSIECNLNKRGVCVVGDVRLAGSSRNSSGRVEVCFKHVFDNVWGTVCGDGWDDADASVVCRMLNY
jgi:deleted-in-malignant-brain-tumors protein 1